jgi:hypothetical protein
MRLVASLLGLVGALAPPGASLAVAQSCAMCGSALVDDPVGRAFSWSVLFLMAAPYTIAGTIGGWIVLRHRRAGQHRHAAVVDLARTGRPDSPAEPHTEGDLS